MDAMNWVALVAVCGLAIYLGLALLTPERFS